MIRVVVIDDSAFMRKAIQIMLESDPEIKVVGNARDGQEGVEKVAELKPDCVTLDLEMPRMNGLEALEIIMRDNPTPVLVVSSISTEGAAITLDALEKGAVDYIAKTESFVAIDITKIKEDLLQKVRAIVRREPAKKKAFLKALQRRRERQSALDTQDEDVISYAPDIEAKHHSLVVIGVSTGGPPVVQHILENLPADLPAGIVIAQHMPATFTKPFADRLNKVSQLQVKEAEPGDVITKGVVLIGRGGKHLVVRRQGSRAVVELSDQPEGLLYFPSADVLFSSSVKAFGARTLGLILTGMGKDGVLGLHDVNKANGTIVAQNEDSCVVYGMPKAAVDAGITDIIAPASQMPSIIKHLVF